MDGPGQLAGLYHGVLYPSLCYSTYVTWRPPLNELLSRMQVLKFSLDRARGPAQVGCAFGTLESGACEVTVTGRHQGDGVVLFLLASPPGVNSAGLTHAGGTEPCA